MITIGNYTLMIVKKTDKEPVRLQKQITGKEQLEQLMARNSTKINIILIILLLILFVMVCNMIVPKTYGYFMF